MKLDEVAPVLREKLEDRAYRTVSSQWYDSEAKKHAVVILDLELRAARPLE